MMEPSEKTQPLWLNTISNDAFLTVEEVSSWLKVSKNSIRRWVRIGLFPRPTKFSRTARWKVGDVKNWLKNHDQINDGGE